MGIILSIIVFFVFSFFVIHLRPLKEKEIEKMVKIRRRKKCEKYYKHSKEKIEINPELKKKMNPDGEFKAVNFNLFYFPALVSGMLKYKKHEWIVIAFERNKVIEYVWINKGSNKYSVSSRIKHEDLVKFALSNQFCTIMVLHNHPNPDGSIVNALPSSLDEHSASKFGNLLKDHCLNLIEFISDRGLPFIFYFSFADTFFPEEEIKNTINSENRESLLKNFFLHCERIFNTAEIRLI